MCYISAFVVGGRCVYGLMLGVIETPCSSCCVPVWRIMDAGCFAVPEGFRVWKYAHGLCFLLPSVLSLPFQRLLTPEMVGQQPPTSISSSSFQQWQRGFCLRLLLRNKENRSEKVLQDFCLVSCLGGIFFLLFVFIFFPYEDPSSSLFSESLSPAIHLESGVTATLKAGHRGGPYSGVAPLPLSCGLRK